MKPKKLEEKKNLNQKQLKKLPNFTTLLTCEMEFKVRRESQSFLEKVFNIYERRGVVRPYQMGTLLRQLDPEIQFDEDELKRIISINDDGKSLGLDFMTYSRVCMHFLVRKAKREPHRFNYKNQFGIYDFPSTEV